MQDSKLLLYATVTLKMQSGADYMYVPFKKSQERYYW